MQPTTCRALEALSPEKPAAAEAAIARSAARRATPEGQAEQDEVIRKVSEEFPPSGIDPELAKALSALRLERERLGLSLSDVSERSGIEGDDLETRNGQGTQSHIQYPPRPGPRP
jgi:hypothetical protein